MKKLKVAMVGGGGPRNLFGPVHRRSIALDATRELTAGALRSSPKSSLESASELGIAGYADYKSLIEVCKKGDLDVDYVTIVTTNETHHRVAKACLESGIPVLCEKPMTISVEEARDLGKTVEDAGLPFVLVHTYTGHAMVMLARELVQNGDIGQVRKVESWYTQGWMAGPVEKTDNPQAVWRSDPKRSGISGCGGDIGTHAHVAACWVTGLKVKKLSARLNSFGDGRALDDDFNVTAELENGATALINATQIAVGYKNDNGFRIFGSKGSVEWRQERAEKLLVRRGGADEVFWIGSNYDYFPASIKPYLRLPGGHNEDFFEALANLHLTMEFMIRIRNGEENIPLPYPHPGVSEGIDGLEFITAAVESSKNDGAYVEPG
jgi:predicted dehydrogenase